MNVCEENQPVPNGHISVHVPGGRAGCSVGIMVMSQGLE